MSIEEQEAQRQPVEREAREQPHHSIFMCDFESVDQFDVSGLIGQIARDVMMNPDRRRTRQHPVDERGGDFARFVARRPLERDESEPERELDVAAGQRCAAIIADLKEDRRWGEDHGRFWIGVERHHLRRCAGNGRAKFDGFGF